KEIAAAAQHVPTKFQCASPTLQKMTMRARNLADMKKHNMAKFKPTEFELIHMQRIQCSERCDLFGQLWRRRNFEKLKLAELCPGRLKFTSVDNPLPRNVVQKRQMYYVKTVLDPSSDKEDNNAGPAGEENTADHRVDLGRIVAGGDRPKTPKKAKTP
ncbi:unnamed protein product, partial [Amoebophrya sp. A120]